MMKLAQFEEQERGWLSVSGAHLDEVEGYIRISEWVDVDFPPLPTGDVVPRQLAAIDAEIAEVIDESEKRLSKLNRRKADLMALPAPEEK